MKKINKENIIVLNAVIFTVVAFMHFLRLVSSADIFISTYAMPLWFSGVLMILIAALAILNLNLIKEKTKVFWLKYILGLIFFDGLFALYFWVNKINYLGISFSSYSVIFLLDLILVLTLIFYIRKMKKLL
ncbi:MAG: hypothetical protein ACLFNO_00985 [Parcubacteria group bacterium]